MNKLQLKKQKDVLEKKERLGKRRDYGKIVKK